LELGMVSSLRLARTKQESSVMNENSKLIGGCLRCLVQEFCGPDVSEPNKFVAENVDFKAINSFHLENLKFMVASATP
jgi:hypothetical protein